MSIKRTKSNAGTERRASRAWGKCEGILSWWTWQPFEHVSDFIPDGVLTPHCHGVNPDNGVPVEYLLLCENHANQFQKLFPKNTRGHRNLNVEITKQLQRGLTTIELDGQGKDGHVAVRAKTSERDVYDPSDEECWAIYACGCDRGDVYCEGNGSLIYIPKLDCDAYLYPVTLRCIADFIDALETFEIAKGKAETTRNS